LNVLINIIRDIWQGRPVEPAMLLLFLVALVLYRILGKHIDDFYALARGARADDKKTIIALQRTVIDEMRRADEAVALAERHINQTNLLKDVSLGQARRIKELERTLDEEMCRADDAKALTSSYISQVAQLKETVQEQGQRLNELGRQLSGEDGMAA
jgi:hypothetical protein